MNLLLRLAWFAITCGYKPVIGLHQRVKKHFHVLPTDLDVNSHMTNSRYLAIMNVASLEILARFGLLRRVFKKGWRPVLAGTLTSRRRSLSKVVFLSSQGMMPVLEVLGELATTPPALPEPVRLWLVAEEQFTSYMAGACTEVARSGSENRGQRHSIEEDAVCSFG